MPSVETRQSANPLVRLRLTRGFCGLGERNNMKCGLGKYCNNKHDYASSWCDECIAKLEELDKEQERKKLEEARRIVDIREHARNHATKTAQYQIHLMEQVLEMLGEINYNIRQRGKI